MRIVHTAKFALRAASRRHPAARCLSSAESHWTKFEMGPPDPIIGLNEAFQKDDHPDKVIVGVGAYRDDEGKPYVLPCVREAERILMDKNIDMEYSGIVSVLNKEIQRVLWWRFAMCH